MGLGKTLTSIAVIWAYISQSTFTQSQRAIVVCPSSLIDNWEKECKKWIGPSLKPLCVRSGSINNSNSNAIKNSKGSKEIITTFQYSNAASILIISYEMYRINSEQLNSINRIAIIVCDEGHRLKNSDGTKTIQALRLVRFSYFILIILALSYFKSLQMTKMLQMSEIVCENQNFNVFSTIFYHHFLTMV